MTFSRLDSSTVPPCPFPQMLQTYFSTSFDTRQSTHMRMHACTCAVPPHLDNKLLQHGYVFISYTQTLLDPIAQIKLSSEEEEEEEEKEAAAEGFLLFCKCFQSPRDTINCCRSWSGYVNWFTRFFLYKQPWDGCTRVDKQILYSWILIL